MNATMTATEGMAPPLPALRNALPSHSARIAGLTGKENATLLGYAGCTISSHFRLRSR